jgi:hypothetical protein
MRSLKAFSAWSKRGMRATPSCGARNNRGDLQ